MTKKKTSVRKSSGRKNGQDMVTRYCTGMFLIALGLIGILNSGLAGEWIHHLAVLLFGLLAVVVLALCVLGGLWMIVRGKLPQFSVRIKAGILVGVLAALLLTTVFTLPENEMDGQILLNQVIARDDTALGGGLTGALVYFLFSKLTGFTGTIVIGILMAVLAIILIVDQKYFALAAQKVKAVPEAAKDKITEYRDKHPKPVKQITLKEEPAEEAQPTIKYKKMKLPRHPKRDVQVITLPEGSTEESGMPSVSIDLPEKKVTEPITLPLEPKSAVRAVENNEKAQDEHEEKTHEPMPGSSNYADYAQYRLPNPNKMLEAVSTKRNNVNEKAAKEKGERLIEVLGQFSIQADLVDTYIGPSVTKFVIRPEANINVNRIVNIKDNIKMELAAKTIRIEAPIPGMRGVGVEIPNVETTPVRMRELMNHIPEKYQSKPLTVALGKDLFDNPVYCDLDKMPHLLVAGQTGSGKSVCMNAIICSLLLRQNPADVKLLLIDPKKVEFSEYKSIPHLIGPVISEPKEAARVLQVIVQMMVDRYDKFAAINVKTLASYNQYVTSHPDTALKKMPYIVVIIDELADLMVVAGKEVEQSIQRITQLARAAGIHLIVATQRPSTDVITGVIKANIPSRISFAVTNGIDSKVILDQPGAENLLGNGDMLYKPQGISPRRLQGVYLTDNEIHTIAEYVSSQAKPFYADEIYNALHTETDEENSGFSDSDKEDPMYSEVVKFVIREQKASTSLIQRKFGLGYNRAARIVDRMQQNGIVGPANGSKPREVFMKPEDE